jgi:hypothetical protein
VTLDADTLDRLVERVAHGVARADRADPVALLVLLRRVSASARHGGPGRSGHSDGDAGLAGDAEEDDIADALGAALARELAGECAEGDDDDAAAWLTVFSAAAAISDDPRLARAVAEGIAGVRRRWRDAAATHTPVIVEAAMRTVEGCLLSVNAAGTGDLAAEAIDEMERIVAGAYRPGQGMAHVVPAAAFVRGGLGDHVCSASALLTAYMLSGRLPYAMLADELMQGVLRSGAPALEMPFALACDAARVFCVLAALHRDEAYRRAAVLAEDADYGSDARRTLALLAPDAEAKAMEAAPFCLALAEWLNLQ